MTSSPARSQWLWEIGTRKSTESTSHDSPKEKESNLPKKPMNNNLHSPVIARPEIEESRQRIRTVYVNMVVIHSIANLIDLLPEEDSDIVDARVLRLTFFDMPPRGWNRAGESIEWILAHHPSREFYNDPLYKLTVFTRETPCW